jgi:SRSO17 transposase
VRYQGHGRPAHRLRRAPGHQPLTVKQLAMKLKPSAWRTVTWREGTNGTLFSRFARVRVRAAHRDYLRTALPEEQWLLVEWPAAETEPTKYWLANVPADISFKQLVDTAKMRWRIEHDYHELKQEFGLSHYEGRGWLGFHHHATLCIAAYGFLTAQRLKQASKKNTARLQAAALPADYQPRGSRSSTTPRPRFDSHAALSPQHSIRSSPPAMPVLRVGEEACVTQYD